MSEIHCNGMGEDPGQEGRDSYSDDECCLCGDMIDNFGNNAQPIADGRCCDFCNDKVIAERIKWMIEEEE